TIKFADARGGRGATDDGALATTRWKFGRSSWWLDWDRARAPTHRPDHQCPADTSPECRSTEDTASGRSRPFDTNRARKRRLQARCRANIATTAAVRARERRMLQEYTPARCPPSAPIASGGRGRDVRFRERAQMPPGHRICNVR